MNNGQKIKNCTFTKNKGVFMKNFTMLLAILLAFSVSAISAQPVVPFNTLGQKLSRGQLAKGLANGMLFLKQSPLLNKQTAADRAAYYATTTAENKATGIAANTIQGTVRIEAATNKVSLVLAPNSSFSLNLLQDLGDNLGGLAVAPGWNLSGPPYHLWFMNGDDVIQIDAWSKVKGQSDIYYPEGNVSIGTNKSYATLTVGGAISTEATITDAPSITVDDSMSTIYFSANAVITLPDAASCPGRNLCFVPTSVSCSATSATPNVVLPRSSVPQNVIVSEDMNGATLQSDGNIWRARPEKK
jgi:hypothetical protein